MDVATLQRELLDLLFWLQRLNPTHLTDILSFLQHRRDDLIEQPLTEVIREVTPSQLEFIISRVMKGGVDDPFHDPFDDPVPASREDDLIDKLPDEFFNAFSILIDVHNFRQLLLHLSPRQLSGLYDTIAAIPLEQQLHTVQQIQQFLGQLLPETLVTLHDELAASPHNSKELLASIFQLKLEHFHLYQPLDLLFKLERDDLCHVAEVVPVLQPSQVFQLLQLLQLDLLLVLEIQRICAADGGDGSSGSGATSALTVSILEQPPERSVYKRNLKPNPAIKIGGADEGTGDLFVAPILINCSTGEEKPELMSGAAPVKTAPGGVVVFKRLKILVTSHQMAEALFAIKFELRRYDGDVFVPLSYVQSNPVCVMSHSTQLRPVKKTTASITEVIPYRGSIKGGTRVVILGDHFVDTPAARVRFDSTDVMPIFHGPKTLICSTPPHPAGTVTVRVSNSNSSFSTTASMFTFEDIEDDEAEAEMAEGQMLEDSYGLGIADTITDIAFRGNVASAAELVGSSSFDADVYDARGFTAFHYAASAGHMSMTELLAKLGANPNKVDKKGNSALHWAAVYGHLAVAQTLLSCGANTNISNFDGLTPLHAALLMEQNQVVRELLRAGAKLNPIAAGGQTPLHCAVAVRSEGLVAELLHSGAFVELGDEEGEKPLHYAARENCPSMVDVLLAARGDVNALNVDFETPLHVAVSAGSLEAVQSLLAHGANPNLPDACGVFPLHQAAENGNVAAVNALIASGAVVSNKDKAGRTALEVVLLQHAHMRLVSNQAVHAAVFQALLEAGAPLATLDLHKSAGRHKRAKRFAPSLLAPNMRHQAANSGSPQAKCPKSPNHSHIVAPCLSMRSSAVL